MISVSVNSLYFIITADLLVLRSSGKVLPSRGTTGGLVEQSRGPGQTESVLQSKHIYKVGGGGGPPVPGRLVSRLPVSVGHVACSLYLYPSYVDVTQSKYHDHRADHLYLSATTPHLTTAYIYFIKHSQSNYTSLAGPEKQSLSFLSSR